jgi:hypothetical protein
VAWFRYEEWWVVRPPPKKDNTGWCLLALVGAAIGGAANGWGGAAIGFVLVCFLWGLVDKN